MSINWAMVEAGRPVTLPGETFSLSTNRVTVECVATSASHKSRATGTGSVHLSNQRLVFVAGEGGTYHVGGRGDKAFNSLSVPLDKIQGGRVVSPWFGPYEWECHVEPGPDGGLEPATVLWKTRFMFKDGGVVEFAEVIRRQRESFGQGEQLPAYEE